MAKIDNPKEFLDLIEANMKKRGTVSRLSPSGLCDRWAYFIQECAEGYQWCSAEYDNDIVCRDYLGEILEMEALKEFVQYDGLAERVEELDQQFKALLQHGVARPYRTKTWWRCGILKQAGEEYCEDMKGLHGIDVTKIE